MFYARKNDLKILNEIYKNDNFSFVVLYGRRRIGKTTLLKEFIKNKNAIFYSAQLKNDKLNLENFSYCIEKHYEGNYLAPFEN